MEASQYLPATEKNLTEVTAVANYMREAKSEEDFERRAMEVKAANGDKYPWFWQRTILNGVLKEIKANW